MFFTRTFTRIFFWLLAVGALSCGLKLYAQQAGGLTPPPKPIETKNSASPTAETVPPGIPFVVGERLAFNVSWSSFATAARLDMEVAERGQFFGQDSFQIRTKVETVGQVRSLFGEIDNQYISYIDPKTALPIRVVNSIRQGQKQSEEVVIFDQARRQAIFPDESSVNISPDTFDLTSLIYGLRLRPLPEGGKQKFTALFGKEVIELEAVVKARERVTTQTGSYNTIYVKFYPQKNLSKYRGYVWLTDDAQRLPVLIQARLSFGELRAELVNAQTTTRPTAPLAKLNSMTDEAGGISIPGINGTYNKFAALPFAIGERLNYDIAWGNFTSVGRASFEVRQQGMLGNNRVYEFYGEATTIGAARTLINVNDQISSFVLVDRLMPLRTDLRLREGRRIKIVSANYDWIRKTASLSSGSEVALQPVTFDLVSLFYAIRASDLKPGAAYNYPFLDANHRLQLVTIKVIKPEVIGGPMGNRDTLQIDIFLPGPSPILIAQAWITNDSRRLPIYFVTRTRFGELRFQMTNAVNTK